MFPTGSHDSPFNTATSTALLAACLILSIAAVYWRVYTFGFIGYDDSAYVSANYTVQSGLSLRSIKWSFTTLHAGFWQPLVWLSFLVDYELFGLHPGGFHITNVFLHTVNSLLLFFLLKIMTGSQWKSWFVAAFFALHPLHVESVAWIAERKDVLSTTFLMLTLLSYISFVKKSSRSSYVFMTLCFTMGLMSKAMLVSLPILLLLFDYWPLNRFQLDYSLHAAHSHKNTPILALLKEKVPLFFIAVIFSCLTIFSQKAGGAIVSQTIHPISYRLANAVVSYGAYIGKMIYPFNLAVVYPFAESIALWKTIFIAVVLVIFSAITLKAATKYPYVAMGWFWYLVTLIPVIGIIQVGPQSMADRFTYIPLIGLYIVIVWSIDETINSMRLPKFTGGIAAFLVIACLSLISWHQLGYWQNSYTLFSRALQVTENNYVAHSNLGVYLIKKGKTEEATNHLRKALEIAPGYKTAHNSLGIALAKDGKLEEALDSFSMALQIDPDFANAHYNMGLALVKMGKLNEAAVHFSETLKQHPFNPKANYYLGSILAEQGELNKAVEHFKRALEIRPNDPRTQENLKRALTTSRKTK
jgi:Flp pilus assembly protein TadD